jgi:hypothetical protein
MWRKLTRTLTRSLANPLTLTQGISLILRSYILLLACCFYSLFYGDIEPCQEHLDTKLKRFGLDLTRKAPSSNAIRGGKKMSRYEICSKMLC